MSPLLSTQTPAPLSLVGRFYKVVPPSGNLMEQNPTKCLWTHLTSSSRAVCSAVHGLFMSEPHISSVSCFNCTHLYTPNSNKYKHVSIIQPTSCLEQEIRSSFSVQACMHVDSESKNVLSLKIIIIIIIPFPDIEQVLLSIRFLVTDSKLKNVKNKKTLVHPMCCPTEVKSNHTIISSCKVK